MASIAVSKPKRIYCFICGSIQEKEEEKYSLFCVPKGKLEQWSLAIGSDKLKQTSRLCEAHFLEVDVIKGKMILGSFFPEKHHLKKDAVPKLLLVPRNKFCLRKPLQSKTVSHITKDKENVQIRIKPYSRMPKRGISNNVLSMKDTETVCPVINHSGDTCMNIEIINNTAVDNENVPSKLCMTTEETETEGPGGDHSGGSCMDKQESNDSPLENDYVTISSQFMTSQETEFPGEDTSSVICVNVDKSSDPALISSPEQDNENVNPSKQCLSSEETELPCGDNSVRSCMDIEESNYPTLIHSPEPENEIVVPSEQCTSLEETEKESSGVDHSGDSDMDIQETNDTDVNCSLEPDNDKVVPSKQCPPLEEIQTEYPGAENACIADRSDFCCIEETNDNAVIESPIQDNGNVIASKQCNSPEGSQTEIPGVDQSMDPAEGHSPTAMEPAPLLITQLKSRPSCMDIQETIDTAVTSSDNTRHPFSFSPVNGHLSPEMKEEIRRSWDIIFCHMPEMRNTLEHAGSFARRYAASSPVCEFTLPTRKTTFNKKKHKFQSSRTSCYNCNAPVSATSMKMRKTKRVCCAKCYPLLKQLEESERQVEFLKSKYIKMRNLKYSIKKKLDRSCKMTEDLRTKLQKCEDRIKELTTLQVDEQIKILPIKV